MSLFLRKYKEIGVLETQRPIFIPVFNNASYAEWIVAQLLKLNSFPIIILDNKSSVQCQKRLEELSLNEHVHVISLETNYGPHFILENKRVLDYLPEKFVLTDPDLLLGDDLPRDFIDTLVKVSNRFKIGKVGLALEVPPSSFFSPNLSGDPLYKDHAKHSEISLRRDSSHPESIFWRFQLENDMDLDLYLAPVDTTFAVYNKEFFNPPSVEAIRVAGNFTCLHRPWYEALRMQGDENDIYLKKRKFGSN